MPATTNWPKSNKTQAEPLATNRIFPYVNRKISYLGIFLFGIFGSLSIDIAFGLIYRNYILFSQPLLYAIGVVVAFIALKGITKINAIYAKKLPWQHLPVQRFMVQAITNVLFVVLLVLIVRIIEALSSLSSAYINLNDTLVIMAIVSAFAIGYVFIDLSVFLLVNWRQSLAEIESFKKENIAFQFAMLRTQINPHFLFNSLNTLSSLIFNNQQLASDYTRQLSRVYRYILENRENSLTSLGQELEILKDYIQILTLRFQDKLFFEISIRPEALSQQIPPMSLQMLIENAIKHNTISSKKSLTIKLIAPTAENELEICNNINPKTTHTESNEVGLSNIKRRYAYLTDKPVIVSNQDGQFCVKIPLLAPQQTND